MADMLIFHRFSFTWDFCQKNPISSYKKALEKVIHVLSLYKDH